MTNSSSYDTTQNDSEMDPITISTFPMCSQLATTEQVRGFELLRLAFFALKLRKFEQRYKTDQERAAEPEYEFRRSLLRHAIFQQVVSLTTLGAREQAMGLIAACTQSCK